MYTFNFARLNRPSMRRHIFLQTLLLFVLCQQGQVRAADSDDELVHAANKFATAGRSPGLPGSKSPVA